MAIKWRPLGQSDFPFMLRRAYLTFSDTNGPDRLKNINESIMFKKMLCSDKEIDIDLQAQRVMISSFIWVVLCSIDQRTATFTGMKKNSFRQIINMRKFSTEMPEVFGATVQNRLAQDLCNRAVLMCLEWFLRRSPFIPIQIANNLNPISNRKHSEVSPLYI